MFQGDQDVHVLNPGTKEWRVTKGAKVAQYLGAGWTLASPAAVEARAREEAAAAKRRELATLPEAAKAELEGYASGLTGGLSNVVGAAVSEEYTPINLPDALPWLMVVLYAGTLPDPVL